MHPVFVVVIQDYRTEHDYSGPHLFGAFMNEADACQQVLRFIDEQTAEYPDREWTCTAKLVWSMTYRSETEPSCSIRIEQTDLIKTATNTNITE